MKISFGTSVRTSKEIKVDVGYNKDTRLCGKNNIVIVGPELEKEDKVIDIIRQLDVKKNRVTLITDAEDEYIRYQHYIDNIIQVEDRYLSPDKYRRKIDAFERDIFNDPTTMNWLVIDVQNYTELNSKIDVWYDYSIAHNLTIILLVTDLSIWSINDSIYNGMLKSDICEYYSLPNYVWNNKDIKLRLNALGLRKRKDIKNGDKVLLVQGHKILLYDN